MKQLIQRIACTGILAIGVSASVFADHKTSTRSATDNPATDNTFYTYGEVINAQPIFRRVVESTPVEQCRQVNRRRVNRSDHHHDEILPSLLGGLLGGVVGHQFGGGRGKKVLTIAGAFAGASIAKNSVRKHEQRYRRIETREHCEIVYQEHEVEKIDGYRVTYLYQGQEFTRRTRQHPGSQIQLRVRVEPVEEQLISSI